MSKPTKEKKESKPPKESKDMKKDIDRLVAIDSSRKLTEALKEDTSPLGTRDKASLKVFEDLPPPKTDTAAEKPKPKK